MTEVFKIIKHKYDYKVAPKLIYNINIATRGNDFRLSKNRSHYDSRKLSFTNRILDNFWMSQDVKYDYTVNLASTGD